jgi:uncharacterized protein
MVDDDFEWDDDKADANVAKHGITFDAARGVFGDPFAIDFLDERQEYREDRYAIIGMVEGRLLYVGLYRERGQKADYLGPWGQFL